MKSTTISLRDPLYKRTEKYNLLEKFFVQLLHDERDLPFIYLCLKVTFLVLPFSIYLVIPGNFNFFIATIYLIFNCSIFMPPVVLMTHSTSHRKFFKQKYRYLNYYLIWIIGPFYGLSANTFFAHHIGMHHIENNLPNDLNCTIPYQRDSIIDFGIYFFKFIFFIIVDLPRYFMKNNRSYFAKKVLFGEFSFILLCLALIFINWQSDLFVFIIPYILVRFFMMAGNWGEHAFIDSHNVGNLYRNSVTNINCLHNRRCFNNGYHIGHHLRPGMHWTELPQDFLNNINCYIDEKPVIFEGLDSVLVWFHLMIKNYRYLASRFVDVGNRYLDQEEVIAFLKERTKKIVM